ncbi:YihY/virulence factor BrkB family protein [Streptacidiphilus sp. 4-A2]|nr:YihY/virulence factor BrkB family protein [Streptacidiphilus sp. 4-A2]
MDWLTRLPVIGPVVAWLLRSRPYRVYEHFNDVGSNRLAGAVTFFGFLALFPLLTVAMAVAIGTLSAAQVHTLQDKIAAQVPALSQSLDLEGLVRNAATVGLVSGLLLLISGLGWVDTTRVAVRTVWRLPVEPGNAVLRKAQDLGVLLGLGLAATVSLAASAFAGSLTGQVTHWLGIEHSTAGRYLLAGAAYVIAVGSDMLIFAYLLVGLPPIRLERSKAVFQAALMGAIGFELLKQLLSAYLSHIARKSTYGAFGTPVALLLWLNIIFRWLLYCVAWTATADPVAGQARARDRAVEEWRAAGGWDTPGAGSVPVPPQLLGGPAVPSAPSVPVRPGRPGGRIALAAAFGSGFLARGLLARRRARRPR